MIRMLHTADLHLGKTLHERDISEDQEHMLRCLARTVAERGADILVIAGDIYDRSIPPPESVRLFDTFLSGLMRDNPDLIVVLIPGNHDSAARLSFGASLLSRAGLHIRTSAADCVNPVMTGSEGDSVDLWALPFLTPGAFPLDTRRDAANLAGSAGTASPADAPRAPRSQSELMTEALSRIKAVMDPGRTNILVAHCFVAGAASSDSERSFVGEAEQVDSGLFDGFDFVALGHLHRNQTPGGSGRIHYSGSPLAYSFGESEQQKGFVFVTLSGKKIETEFIPMLPLRAMRRIRGSFALIYGYGDTAGSGFLPGLPPVSASDPHELDYIEAVLTDPEAVLNARDALRQRYPNLLSVRQEAFEAESASGADRSDQSAGGLAGGDAMALDPVRAVISDFRVFHREMKGAEPADSLAALFGELVREAEHATL